MENTTQNPTIPIDLTLTSDFKVNHPSFGKWIIYLILSILLSMGMMVIPNFYALWRNLLFGIVIVVILAPKIWSKGALSIIRNNVISSLKVIQSKKEPCKKIDEQKHEKKKAKVGGIFNSIIGIKLPKENHYFIQKTPKIKNLNKITDTYAKYIFDVISASIGITFLLAFAIKYIFGNIFPSPMVILVIIIIFLCLSPLFMFWLLPVLWTLKDVDVRSQNAELDIDNLGDQMRQGFFRKVLGFTGFITGIGFFLDLGPDFWSNIPNIQNSIQIYVFSAVYLGLFALSIGGTATLITLIYLNKYHEKNVNILRQEIAQFLPMGNTKIEY